MSRTTTATTKTKALQRSGSIILSPPKRRKLSEDVTSSHPIDRPSEKEMWEWTMTSAAVAKCCVRDALTMSECSEGWFSFDFFWLGNVPCRKIEICGIVVGIQVLEKKVLYTGCKVDDGTEVIDLVHIPQRPPRPKVSDKNAPPESLPPLRPICWIGGVVKAKGKVQRKHETRVMIVDEISSSTLDVELAHWKAVRELHETRYNSSEPFVIPVATNVPETPRKSQNKVTDVQTPSVISVSSRRTIPTPSTIVSSPIVITSSPIKPKFDPQSPPKLRHPSRLRSQNLTDTAFRLYVKHFVDNAPGDTPRHDSDSDEDLEELYKASRPYTSQILDTPTKSRARSCDDSTPRSGARKTPNPSTSTSTTGKPCQGFTLSYLRRVPELSLIATRVVKQHAKILEKKARDSQSTSKSSSAQPTKCVKLDRAGLAVRKKRLFQWAICKLLREGSIVLWDGPTRPCPEYDTYGNANASMLWKYSSSSSAENSLFSNAGNLTRNDDDEMELSDPEPEEEAYISTKPELLVPSVTEALKALALAPPVQVMKRNELIGGSTKKEILAYLRRDDRWAFIGDWNVAEALEYMNWASLAWCVGERWMLTQ
ncbi:hypothetical protein AN958_12652 [Leucoagaricus sp. SymC.cos]|nr:hypothetical protein AN958_12652 [Leucoagaricus sp. SymC.cos]